MLKDLTGERFHYLTVIEGTKRKVLVKCKCGNEKIVYRYSLLDGLTKSCGCWHKRRMLETHFKHGHAGEQSRTYRIWAAMKARCDNPLKEHYDRYGGRGITYDPSWANFAMFLRDMGQCPENKELDRKNNDLGYSKENCRWVTHQENCANKGTIA